MKKGNCLNGGLFIAYGGLRSLAMEDAIHQCIYDLMRLRKEFLGYAYDMRNSNLKAVKNDRVGL